MPKSRRKERGKVRERAGDAGDEELFDDNASVLSILSNNSDRFTDAGSEGSDQCLAEDEFEYKLIKCFEGIEEKSAKTRIESLKSICSALSKKSVYNFISERCVTLCDGLGRCIKRGRGEEQVYASMCVSALLVQVGLGPEKDELFKDLSPILRGVISDVSMSLGPRCQCLETLGLCSLICMEEPSDMLDLMAMLEGIFRSSYCLKGDSLSSKSLLTKLHNSALLAWNLLLTIVPKNSVIKFIPMYLTPIASMLKSNSMELRITAGESIALMFEIGITEDNFMKLVPNYEELSDLMRGMACESNKFRAKKDKKVQRSIFRDVCKMVETLEFEEFDVQISDYEKITIDSWSLKVRYDTLCKVLGTGMNFHLQENPLLREMFDLGEPICTEKAGNLKGSKEERKFYHKVDFKRRTKCRTEQRSYKMLECEDDGEMDG